MRKIGRSALVVLACCIFKSCDESEPVIIVPETLLDSELVLSKTRAEILAFIQSTGLPFPVAEIKFDVDIYKVTYTTSLNGADVIASGLVGLPKTNGAVGMVSFQHGTISAHRDAPSVTPPADDIMKFYAAMASPGLIGVVPDLIGFGSSENVIHPYYVEEPTAAAVIDNLKAARELALTMGLQFNERLFLAGYSQGGYATMAAHKAIEEKGLDHFELIASFPAAGGYDIKGVQEYFFAQTQYEEPFYIAYVAMAYKSTYDWDAPLSDFFKEPYASKIPNLFDGEKSASEINSELTNAIADLINPDLLAAIDSDPGFAYLVDAFNENSLTDWAPKKKMYMYHGELDSTVPYQNSVDVYNKFLANGASQDVVTFTPLVLATHGTGVTPYLIEFTNKLIALK